MKLLFLAAFLAANLCISAQDNFTYSPAKPKPGDVIQFEYTPSGDLSGITKIPEAFVMESSGKKNKVTDLVLERNYGKLAGSFKTDTSDLFIAFGFTSDGKYDNNAGNGYWLQLYDGDKVRIGSNAKVAQYYSYLGSQRFGLNANPQKAVEFYKKEFEAYPASKDTYLTSFLQSSLQVNEADGKNAVQQEIEKTLQKGLATAKDYDQLISLYRLLRLPQQMNFMTKIKQEKITDPGGVEEISANAWFQKFNAEQDLTKKETLLDSIILAEKASSNKEQFNGLVNYLRQNLASAYLAKKDHAAFQRIAGNITDNSSKYSMYNNTAWEMQEDSSADLQLAEKLSKEATTWAKNEITKPTGTKPDLSTSAEWLKSRKNTYAMYADTYAMILHRMGQSKKGLPFAKEAAFGIYKGDNVDYNGTYALLAQKALPEKQYQPQFEQFVKNGKANAAIKDALKLLYKKQHNNDDAGFDTYIAGLEKEAHEKLLAELKEKMINDAAPTFTLNDTAGNPVSLASLKGKVVIVDFWATWCGPCKASFPSMQEMVNKYKNDESVKFLFVDTWENEEDKLTPVKEFIAKNSYPFHVLMDNESKVVKDFQVSGIPTKFVIGKDGKIKFKSVGFSGDEALKKELAAMIELAN